MIIAANTFEATEATETFSFGETTRGTIEVTLDGETRRVRARKFVSNAADARRPVEYTAYDMLGRYRTGAKAWSAYVIQSHWDNGKISESADFGRDDRSGRFNKLNCLYFA